MLHVALIFLCIAQILHFGRHWLILTQRMQEEARDARIRTELDWKNPRRNPNLGGGTRTGLFSKS